MPQFPHWPNGDDDHKGLPRELKEGRNAKPMVTAIGSDSQNEHVHHQNKDLRTEGERGETGESMGKSPLYLRTIS